MDSPAPESPAASPAGSHSSPGILLRLENVSKTFRMGEVEVKALKHATLDIYEGELLVLLGPSGSGKSTLLNILGGLDTPTSGHVWFRGQDLANLSPRELTRYRRDTIGFVFQFFNLVPTLTARENVMVSTEIARAPLDVDEALHLVDLAKRSDHFPSQMSGGEQQRVAIARAVAKNPELLLCDEPTGSLDVRTGKMVLALLADLRRKLNKTVIVITHNVAIAHMADRVVRISSGEIHDITVNETPSSAEEVDW
ncbi:MAG: ABC transporter ATP-binding protein [Pirellulales bacterium]|nr:ABC transporter ATP-binding protein [Pirellulales bacterium]